MKKIYPKLICIMLVVIFACGILSGCEAMYAKKYEKAQALYSQGKYSEAADIFSGIRDYKDSYQLAADSYFEAKDYESASEMYLYLSSKGSQKNIYRKAVCNYELGDYDNASYTFEKIPEYGDASKYLVKIYLKKIANAELNDIVKFGRYEQDNDDSNGKEAIEWNVVAKEGSKVLLISDKILDYQPYSTGNELEGGATYSEETFVSWKDTHLRSWLNNDFYNIAFNEDEKGNLLNVLLTTKNKGGLPSCETNDNVFILSAEEFDEISDKATVGTLNQIVTEYAKESIRYEDCWNSCYTRDQKPYNGIFGLSSVYSPGTIDKHNTIYYMSKSSELGAIRPCIWVNTASLLYDEEGKTEEAYERAKSDMESKKYDAAMKIFEEISNYKDSATLILECRYLKAVDLFTEGQAIDAYPIFVELADYKESKTYQQKIEATYVTLQLNYAVVGATVTFGAYEQDNDISNGKETIEWLVLSKENDKILLITKSSINAMSFDTQPGRTTWANSTSRQWLNSTFYNEAFSNDEQKAILESTLENYCELESIDDGATVDRVFLLSEDECKLYFKDPELSVHKYGSFTKYATAMELAGRGYSSDERDWWLRSRSKYEAYGDYNFVHFVSASGISGNPSTYYHGIRPAVLIDLTK